MSSFAILFRMIANCMWGKLAVLLEDGEIGCEGSGDSFVIGGSSCVVDAVE